MADYAAVPTIFSGSEQTNIWGISNENGKTTGKDERVYPRYVLYDSDVTVGMPQSLAMKSSMNAMAHLTYMLRTVNGHVGSCILRSGIISHTGRV